MFHQPVQLDDALRLRRECGAAAVVINGATDVSVAMNHGAVHPREYLDLSRVAALRQVERDGDFLVLGAGVTFAQLGRLHLRALREAALSVAGPAIRNMGTIGGNLVTASPAGDGCVALLAMHADVELTSVERGPRWVGVRDFFLGYRRTALAEDELVTRVRAPHNPVTRWYKIGKRGAVNISLVCCALARLADGRHGLAFGCVGPVPLCAPRAEKLLDSGPLTEDLIEQVAAEVAKEVTPIDDFRGSADYRRAMCSVLAGRLLRDLAAANGKGDADV